MRCKREPSFCYCYPAMKNRLLVPRDLFGFVTGLLRSVIQFLLNKLQLLEIYFFAGIKAWVKRAGSKTEFDDIPSHPRSHFYNKKTRELKTR